MLACHAVHMDSMTTADRLTEAITARMGARGLTEAALADASGIPRVTLRRRLTTGRGWTVDEIDRIADALGTDPGALFIAATTPVAA